MMVAEQIGMADSLGEEPKTELAGATVSGRW
jgi:hypothetical protein